MSETSQLLSRKLSIVGYRIDRKNGGLAMRLFIACAIIISTAIGLAGCFGHHEKAVITEPLKLG